MLWITARGGHVGMYGFVFVYVHSFDAMSAAGWRWHHRGSSLVFLTNKGRGVGACSPPFFYASVLSHNVSSHSSSRHADVVSFTHTCVCVLARAHTHLFSFSHVQREHTQTHTHQQANSCGRGFRWATVHDESITARHLCQLVPGQGGARGVQESHPTITSRKPRLQTNNKTKEHTKQLPRTSLASRHITQKNTKTIDILTDTHTHTRTHTHTHN